MPALLTIARIFIFLLLILQTFAGSLQAITHHVVQPSLSAQYTLSAEEIKSNVSSLETLQISDALVSPVPSFQFSFTEVLYCFLFVIFSFFIITKIREITSSFTRSYFRILFSSLILINAP